MNSEEIKQTNIYNYFQNNKKTSASRRSLDDKYNNELLKRQVSKKEKNENINYKSNNLKIKDFFCFKEYPEEINEIQKDLKNMHLLSDSNFKKIDQNEISETQPRVNSFNVFLDIGNNSNISEVNNNIQTSVFNSNNTNNNFSNIVVKDKKNYGINKYFPILESREEKRLFNNNLNIKSNSYRKESSLNNTANIPETEKVFILDHFNNQTETTTESQNKLNIELSNSIDNNTEKNSFKLNSAKNENLIITNVDKYSINDVEMLTENKNLTKNAFRILPKNKYQDTKITRYIHIQDPPNMKLNRELLVNVLEYMDLRSLINKVPNICRFWNDLYNKTISSVNYNIKVDLTDQNKISEKEINVLFKKGKNLKHIKLLKEIIYDDFGGNKGVGNFFKKIALIMTLADSKEVHHKGIMLNSFKLRPRRLHDLNNFICSRSINLICEASKYSLKTLVLRNCSKLSNKVFDGISSCIFLNTLEVSFNDLIDDEGLLKLADKCKDLKSLNLTNLTKITEISVRAIAMKMPYLESVDLSECPMITGTDIYYLKNLKNLKLLLLKSIKFCNSEMIFLDYLKNLHTLSISYAQNLSDGGLDQLTKRCDSLVNLDLTRNPNFTEERLFKFVNDMPKLINLKINEEYNSFRIQNLLGQRLRNSLK